MTFFFKNKTTGVEIFLVTLFLNEEDSYQNADKSEIYHIKNGVPYFSNVTSFLKLVIFATLFSTSPLNDKIPFVF